MGTLGDLWASEAGLTLNIGNQGAGAARVLGDAHVSLQLDGAAAQTAIIPWSQADVEAPEIEVAAGGAGPLVFSFPMEARNWFGQMRTAAGTGSRATVTMTCTIFVQFGAAPSVTAGLEIHAMRTLELGTSNLRGFSATVHSPVRLLVIDPFGRETGFNVTTGQERHDIPGASYVPAGTNPERIHVDAPVPGNYTVLAQGVGIGSFSAEITLENDDSGSNSTLRWDGVARQGSVEGYELEVASPQVWTSAEPHVAGGLPVVLVAAAVLGGVVSALGAVMIVKRRRAKP